MAGKAPYKASWARRMRRNKPLALAQVFALFALTLVYVSVEAINPDRADAYAVPIATWSAPGASDTSTATLPARDHRHCHRAPA